MLIRQFLYPSEEDLYNLVRFLVGKLSESSGARKAALGDDDNRRCAAKEGETVQNEEILNGFKDLRLKTRALESSYMISQDDLTQRAAAPNSVSHNVEIRVEEFKAKEQDFSPSDCNRGDHPSYLSEGVQSSRKIALRDQDGSQVNLCW